MIGKIKKIDTRGYGWITSGDTDFFFHMSEYAGNWKELIIISPPINDEGPEVLFKAIEHEKGPRAVKVELLTNI